MQVGEKIHRYRAATDRQSINQPATYDQVQIQPTDSISCQATFLDDDQEPAATTQAFLRFENRQSGADNIYLLRKRGRDMKVDVNLAREIKADLQFWRHNDTYLVQLIMGGLELDSSTTWSITDNMRFKEASTDAFKEPARGVFDFDVSVKKSLLPEFISPITPPEKRAHHLLIIAALAGVLLPIPVLLFGWWKMGVFPLRLKSDDKGMLVVGFELCVLAHIAALAMFWLKWNIVTTWKVMAVLMIPTYLLGRKLLSESDDK